MARSKQSRVSSTAYRLLLTALFTVALFTPAAQAQTLTVLHTFTGGADGYEPYAGVTLDQQGRIYGTTIQGGTHGDGVVFRLAREGQGWALSPIYSFGSQKNDGVQSRIEGGFRPGRPALRNHRLRAAREVGERFSACNLRQPPARRLSAHGLRPSCTTSPAAPMAEIRSTAT